MGRASDPQQVEQQEREARERRALEIEDLRELLALPAGRRFLWGLLGTTGFFAEPWRMNSEKDFLLGRQSIGRHYLTEILDLDPDFVGNMLRISQAEETLRAKMTITEESDG